MISFRDAWRDVRLMDEVQELEQAARDGDAVAFLVRAGELEQAVLDARDAGSLDQPVSEEEFTRLMVEAGRAYLSRQSPAPRALDRAAEALAAIRLTYEEPLRIKAPEGYLHYALDPAAFAEAARRYAAEVGAEQARRAVVLGIRSIGTSLSAVVAAALGTERRATLRPRGPSGQRTIEAESVWRDVVRPGVADGGDVLVVDEGPGATGETFWRVHEWLKTHGVDERRIVLFPSGEGAMPLAPEERRAWFASARRYAPQVDPERVRRVAERFGLTLGDDLSWGAWRGVVDGAAELPAAPIHERVKVRAVDPAGTQWLIRYAGLGRWGASARDRAIVLADLGAGPAVLGAWDGFVVLRWIPGTPLTRADVADPDARAAVARYLAARAGRFRTGKAVDPAPVRAALEENAREALGDVPGLAAALARIDALPPRDAVIADARLAPQEWIRGPAGITKVDAVDHGAGTRLPGPADAAWDLAGAAVEWGFDGAELDALIHQCSAGEPVDELRQAVAAYRPAYAAACLGEMQFARWEAGSDAEAAILDTELDRYRTALTAELATGG
ncbi:hypothetical protein [Longimicrobium terrae]|uniref:Uncharacterized protein n=1 Tax=Longimicrobium terrae TaxID=1639882 RepID=A0A841GTZ1_9BACT|nr:hypothetical protein [Longimicrobium terrae]MBB4634686.1 hypothetical protein [Longimicrobium terrae]MBB6068424.1 hypothetical protein [Longimicrobium terrae]NNC32705.1 hypothetical protein [Longimicrobium terrae]